MPGPAKDDPDTPLKKAAEAFGAHTGDWQQTLSAIAAATLEPLRAARAEGQMNDKMNSIPAALPFVLDGLDYEELAQTLHAVFEPASLSERFKEAQNKEGDIETRMLKRARMLKTQVESLSEAQHFALSSAIESVLPPGLAASVAEMRGGKTLEDEVREVRSLVKNLSPEHIAAALSARHERTNSGALILSVCHAAAEVTPEKLEKLVTYVTENFSTSEMAVLYKHTWEGAEEILDAAAKGDFLSPQNPRKIKLFGQSLQQALSVLEEGLTHAGISLPADLKEVIADHLDSNRLLRQAEAIRQAELARTGTENEISIKPMTVRRRAGKGPSNS